MAGTVRYKGFRITALSNGKWRVFIGANFYESYSVDALLRCIDKWHALRRN